MLKCETIPTVVTRMLFVVDKANIIEEKSHSTRATVATRGRYRATWSPCLDDSMKAIKAISPCRQAPPRGRSKEHNIVLKRWHIIREHVTDVFGLLFRKKTLYTVRPPCFWKMAAEKRRSLTSSITRLYLRSKKLKYKCFSK
jgi:hypothetical protein